MLYFLLPKVNIEIHKYIDCIVLETIPNITISNSLSHYLFEIKNKIKKYEKEWNIYKKYTNPYEFINTIIPGKNKCVSKYKPISRSYFKMIEIIHFLMYDDDCEEPSLFSSSEPIRTFHLAEGPGGFIEAVVNTRKNPADIYYGMTIIDDQENNKLYSLPEIRDNSLNVPGWNKSEYFLKKHPNIILEYGADGTGNLLSMDNFQYCCEKYAGSIDLITADGGFDFSIDFNNQEAGMAQLLFAQVCYALYLQKRGGQFILKIFDCFMEHTLDIIYILSAFYEVVYITKPQTSRYANSEKYLVCKNFKPESGVQSLKEAFQKMIQYIKCFDSGILCNDDVYVKNKIPESKYIHRFLNIPVANFFIYRIEEYNSIFGKQQIDNIYQTIIFIENRNKYEIMPIRNKLRNVNNGDLSELQGFGRKHGFQDHRSSYTNNQEQSKYTNILISKKHTTYEITEGYPLQSRPLASGLNNFLTKRCISDRIRERDNSIALELTNPDIFSYGYNKIENLVKSNIQKCIQWCIKYNISYYSYNDAV